VDLRDAHHDAGGQRLAYFINSAIAKARFGNADKMNFETPLTSLVWITSIVSIIATYIVSVSHHPNLGGDSSQWWKLASIISCGTLAGAVIPELVKVFTSVDSRHVNEVGLRQKKAARPLGILSGFVAGNFFGLLVGSFNGHPDVDCLLLQPDGLGRGGHHDCRTGVCLWPGRIRLPRHGPVTIAVDSYGPVTDNAQSVYELSLIEQVPNVRAEIKKDFNIDVNFERSKDLLEENDGAATPSRPPQNRC